MSHIALPPWEEQQRSATEPSRALMVVEPEQHWVRWVPSQQLPHFLAPEQFFQSNDIEASTHCCAQHFGYTHREISVAQICMDEALVLSLDGQEYHITEKAHSDLCKMLGIPLTFSYEIPADLTSIIVQRLKSLHEQSVVVVSREDIIVSLVDPLKWAARRGEAAKSRVKKRPHYMPVTNLSLLHMLQEVWSDYDVDTRITLADVGIQIEILPKDESLTIQPIVGDVTQVGIVVKNSETGGPLPLATGYTYRLICTNGSTIPQDFGHVRFSSDWRCTLERRKDRFVADLRSLSQDMRDKCSYLQTAYSRMTNEYLDDGLFYNLYRQAQYLFRGATSSSKPIDKIFGLEPNQRQEIIARARHRLRELRGANTAAIEPPQATDILAWTIFNRLTEAARDEARYHRRIGLQSLAGHLMATYLPTLT